MTDTLNLASPSFLKQRANEERHKLFMQEVSSRMIMVTGIGLSLPLVLAGGEPSERMAWTVTAAVLAGLSLLLVAYYNRTKDSEASKVKKWHVINLLLALSWGALWSAMPYVFFEHANIRDILLMVLIVTIFSATPSVSISTYPDTFIAYLTPVFVSLTYFLNVHAEDESWLIRYIPMAPLVSLSFFSLYSHKSHMESIHLRINAELAKHKIQQANDSKARFLAAVSHDLRQPLQAANLYADLLRHNPEAGKSLEEQALFNKLRNSLSACDGLVNRLLALSRLQNKALVARPEVFNLQERLDQLIVASQPQAAQKGLQLELSVEPELSVEADPVFVSQIVSNFLSNAIKFSEQGLIRVSVERQETGLRISVSDQGCGIKEIEQDQIFEEFKQLDDDYRTSDHGLGLGLAIVRQLCELAGYGYELESEEGRGSTFTLVLPALIIQAKPARSGPDF